MDRQRIMALARAHARLTAAADLVRWSLSAEIVDVVPREEIDQIEASIKDLADRAFRAMGDTDFRKGKP